jgi:hypothetical protein
MNNDPSKDEGREVAPPFTPTVEGGVSPLEEFLPTLPSNYFFVLDIRHVNDGCYDWMVRNIIRDCMGIFGSGNFQIWHNTISLCLRISCDKNQLEKFLKKTKETARIWGASENGLTQYQSDYPKAV